MEQDPKLPEKKEANLKKTKGLDSNEDMFGHVNVDHPDARKLIDNQLKGYEKAKPKH